MNIIARALVAILVGVVVALLAWLILALIPGNQEGWASIIGLIAAILYLVGGFDHRW